jgi:hypothetical protein
VLAACDTRVLVCHTPFYFLLNTDRLKKLRAVWYSASCKNNGVALHVRIVFQEERATAPVHGDG